MFLHTITPTWLCLSMYAIPSLHLTSCYYVLLLCTNCNFGSVGYGRYLYGSGAWGLLGCKGFFEQENHQAKREAAFCSHYKYSGDEVKQWKSHSPNSHIFCHGKKVWVWGVEFITVVEVTETVKIVPPVCKLEQYSRINDNQDSGLETTHRSYANAIAAESRKSPEQEQLSLQQQPFLKQLCNNCLNMDKNWKELMSMLMNT